MKYKYILVAIISLSIFLLLLSSVSAKVPEKVSQDKSIPEENKMQLYNDVLYPSEEVLAKQNQTLESYKQSLINNAPKNRNSSVNNIWGTSPLTGTVKIPVLLVQFTGRSGTTSSSTIITKLNSSTITQTSISVSKYYNIQSYGNLNLVFDVYNWVMMPQTFTYYSDNNNTVFYMITDAMAAFNSSVDFSQYDADNDGRLDGIIIIFAGDKGLYPSGIPAQTRILKNYDLNSVDGKYLGNTAIVSEKYNSNSDYIDVIVHEFAHVLGLPDLYSNSDTTSTPGPMTKISMMTSDHTSNSTCRKKPSNLDAWSKYFFGWTNPIILTTESNKQINLRSANDYPDAVILKNNNMTSREYFIIENRYRTNNSLAPYTNLDYCMFNTSSSTIGGFAIYHVDESKIEYDYPNNYVNWDRDGNYYNDTTWPGITYEKNKVDSLVTFDTQAADLYYINPTYPERKYFDENLHIASADIWDMTTRAYTGVTNPFIRFEAFSLTNQQTMTAKMLVGEETANPIANPASGATSNEPIQVALNTPTAGAIIYYTTDGTEPTINSQIYSNPINISQNTTLKAIAKKNNFYVSDVLTANYTVNATVAIPQADHNSGIVDFNSSVIFTSPTDANIYYTTDDNEPTEASTLYVPSSPIVIDHTLTLKARAYKQNWTPSPIATYNYTIQTTTAPTASLPSGDVNYLSSVTLSSTTENAQIYFTTDGTIPSYSSALYQSPIVIDHNFTLKAIAYRDGYSPSQVSTYTYTTSIPTNRIIDFSLQNIQIGNSLYDRNTIYLLVSYDVNRSSLTPIITIEPNCTISPASGIVQDFTRPVRYRVSSATGHRDYTVIVFNDINLNPPTANPQGGSYASPQTVSLMSDMPRSVIRYTTNGQDPLNSSSQAYTAPINISENTTIKARVYYSPRTISSTNIAHSDNADYQYNQIYLKLFKKEYISGLMTQSYLIIRENRSIDQNVSEDLDVVINN